MANSTPNILIFLMDTQPVRNVTCYSYPKDTTPNIQRIADEGLVYEQHYTTGCWTIRLGLHSTTRERPPAPALNHEGESKGKRVEDTREGAQRTGLWARLAIRGERIRGKGMFGAKRVQRTRIVNEQPRCSKNMARRRTRIRAIETRKE